MPHPAVAIGPHRFGPLGEEHNRLVANRLVAGVTVHSRHAAEPLPENAAAIAGRPATQRFARRWQIGLGAEAVQNVVIRHAEVKLARLFVLRFPTAAAKFDAAIVKRFDRQLRR